jgi:hypothetical protein
MAVMPAIPAFRRLMREEEHEFKVSLGYIVRPCLKQNKTKYTQDLP